MHRLLRYRFAVSPHPPPIRSGFHRISLEMIGVALPIYKAGNYLNVSSNAVSLLYSAMGLVPEFHPFLSLIFMGVKVRI